MVFLDANIPMYLVGADHPNRLVAVALVQRLGSRQERLVTDAEVFQEILHRYSALNRPQHIQSAFDLLLTISKEVFPIDIDTVEDAKNLVLQYQGLAARDAIHLAVMKRHGVTRILSFDKGYDRVPGIERIFSL